MRGRIFLGALCALFLVVAAQPSLAGGSFADWSAIVVAGDHRAHSGAESEVFDNARRDVSSALARIGFSSANIVQFSVLPDRHPDTAPRRSDVKSIAEALWDLSERAPGGCFAYFTSHGSPDGIVMGDTIMSPDKVNQILSNACGDKPTVLIISACFSGTFIDQYTQILQAPNRFVLTAARPDRTSFGCGEADFYTFFDTCMLQSLVPAGNFPDLARDVQACVAARERKEHVDYPSEPQLSVGNNVLSQLPRWR